MIPILFDNIWHVIDYEAGVGKIGWLADAVSCKVEENKNGEYFLEMEYPTNGALFSEIKLKACIYAPHDASGKWDFFRICKISKPLDKVVEITAYHLSYDLNGVAVAPFSSTGTCSAAMQQLENATQGIISFNFSTDIKTTGTFAVAEPCSARELLFDKEGSFVDIYGGEWSYDMWQCKLSKERGTHTEVWIRYGSNLADLTQELDDTDQYTAVLGYWKGTQESSTGESVDVVQVGTYQASSYYDAAPRIKVVDFSSDFSDKPSVSQINDKAKAYLNANKGWIYTDSLAVETIDPDSELNGLCLCDWVHVFYDEFGINTELEVVKVVWDVLLDRYGSLELGSKQLTLADTISGLYKKIK